MSNQKYFDVPWALGGDTTVIPDALQTSGTVSFTEGWNYNYQRDLATDPAALPIDRATTNYLMNTITAALQALQAETVPEFILASQNGGAAISYGLGSVVLWSASGNAPFVKFVSIVANNVNTPSTSDVLGATTGWQVVCDPIATSAQATAGTNNASIMTPLLVAQQTALRALLAGSSTQVFNAQAPAQFSNNPQVVTTSYLNEQGLQYSPTNTGQATSTTNYVVPLSAQGARLWFNNTAAQTATLPATATLPNGFAVHFSKVATGSGTTLTIGTNGAVAAIDSGNGLVASIILVEGEDCVMTWNVAQACWMPSGSFLFRFLNFTNKQLLAGTGQQLLPGGLRLQWGSATLTTTTSNVTLPVAASNAVLCFIATANDPSLTNAVIVAAIGSSLTAVPARSSVAAGVACTWYCLTR